MHPEAYTPRTYAICGGRCVNDEKACDLLVLHLPDGRTVTGEAAVEAYAAHIMGSD